MVPASASAVRIVADVGRVVRGQEHGGASAGGHGAPGSRCELSGASCRLAWAGFCRSPAHVCVVQLRTILCTNVLTLTHAHGCRRCRLPPTPARAPLHPSPEQAGP